MIYKGFEIVEFFEKYVVYSRTYVVFEEKSLTGCKNWIDKNLQKNLENGKEISCFSENYINGKPGVLLNISDTGFVVCLFDVKKHQCNQLMLPQYFTYEKSNFRAK